MKKLTILISVVLISITSFGQKLDNEVYIRAGYSNPSWSQFNLDKDIWGAGASKYGFIFEFGSIFMIQDLPAAENMALGINVDYLYGIFNVITNRDDELNIANSRVGSKIGPSFTYSPVDKMAIDIYVKADVAWGSVAVPYDYYLDEADDYFTDILAVGLSTGINFRYSVLMLGIEFNTIRPQLESDDYPGDYLQEDLNLFFNENSDSKKSKLPSLNFTLGLSF